MPEHSHGHTSLILLIAWNLPLLSFCFLLVCMVDKTQVELFQGIMCNIERLKRGTLDPWITGGPKTEERPDLKGRDLRPLFIPESADVALHISTLHVARKALIASESCSKLKLALPTNVRQSVTVFYKGDEVFRWTRMTMNLYGKDQVKFSVRMTQLFI